MPMRNLVSVLVVLIRNPVLSFLLLFSIPSSTNAQSLISDELRKELLSTPNDSNKVKKLLTATDYMSFTQPDSAIFYADSIINFSERIKFEYGKARGYQLKADGYLYKGDYSHGLYFSQQALHLLQFLNDEIAIFGARIQLGNLFSESGDYKKAIAEMHKARAMTNSIGSSYYDRTTDTTILGGIRKMQINYELGKVYLAANVLDSALMLAKAAFKLDQDLKHDWSSPPILLGDVYYKTNDYQSALLSYNTKTTYNFDIDSAKNFIGKSLVFAKIHHEDSCILYAGKALKISERIKYSKGAMQASHILSQIYENIDPKKSIAYYKISTALKDSLYSRDKVNQFNSVVFNEELRKLDAKAAEEAARNKYRIWSLLGVMFTLAVTGILLWRNNQHRKAANILLQQEKQTVEKTLEKLRSTQTLLIQSEKMASLGELTAGIAHEIQNPLNFVNNFSEVNKELLSEMKEEIEKGNFEDAKSLANNVIDNQEKINQHGKRADAIVKGMLQHSRSSSGIKEPTDINSLVDEYVRLAYHGMRAKEKSFNVTLNTSFDERIGNVNVIPRDIGRVILNLLNNAFYAVSEKGKQTVDKYEPVVSISTGKSGDKVLISVKDNGNGIPDKVLDKVFQPFFTTKPTGQGTGLGLSLSYDIVKAHGGDLTVQTKNGSGSEFVIQIPSTHSAG